VEVHNIGGGGERWEVVDGLGVGGRQDLSTSSVCPIRVAYICHMDGGPNPSILGVECKKCQHKSLSIPSDGADWCSTLNVLCILVSPLRVHFLRRHLTNIWVFNTR
jgi:hypothetical protein